jgi:hypothetical protein
LLDQVEAAAGGDEVEGVKTPVFISYSRKDYAFAEKLRVALNDLGFQAYLDKEDILPGEPWRARLEGLILAADAVVLSFLSKATASSILSTVSTKRPIQGSPKPSRHS